jgi:hypothetical protein
MVHLGLSNSRMKDFTDLAIAARRTTFDGDTLVAAIRATFRRRGTQLPEHELVALSEQFVQDARAQANWKAYVTVADQLAFEATRQVEAVYEGVSRIDPFAIAGIIVSFARVAS